MEQVGWNLRHIAPYCDIYIALDTQVAKRGSSEVAASSGEVLYRLNIGASIESVLAYGCNSGAYHNLAQSGTTIERRLTYGSGIRPAVCVERGFAVVECKCTYGGYRTDRNVGDIGTTYDIGGDVGAIELERCSRGIISQISEDIGAAGEIRTRVCVEVDRLHIGTSIECLGTNRSYRRWDSYRFDSRKIHESFG